ncbi:Aldo/keto reductase [Aspergillus affinis]|uniref:Aldo/keto reductase n=1 Tax=Aspergillus affinis TaxID=1070780 RepID=UPI0022FEBF9E|nr:Aldo/keto reductase [Aspergillus affinis]KAI9037398.1 Aldo/keto reductase [Aspergillus affinis]
MTATAIYPSLQGKTVLISGGAEGIGDATVELFALQGSQVIFLDISEEAARKTISNVTAKKPTIKAPIFHFCDLSNLPELQATAARILEEHGPVHILVNNAAATGSGARLNTENVTPGAWDFSVNTNLRHVFFLSQAVIPGMKRVGAGSIVNLGSITWRIPAAGQPVYGACKAQSCVMPSAILTERQKTDVMTPEYRAEVFQNQSLQRDLVPEDLNDGSPDLAIDFSKSTLQSPDKVYAGGAESGLPGTLILRTGTKSSGIKTLPNYAGKYHVLNTRSAIPAIGLGTFQDPDEQELSVHTALKVGYRHIDTVSYETERQAGKGIARSGIPREEIFVTTKLWCNAHHPDDVELALDASLADLGVDYVDLYLMHYPCAFKRVRAIGVSNFSQRELETIINEGTVIPAVHQMELHPYLQQSEFVEWHKARGIHIIQFSPCGNLNNFYREVSWGKEIAQMTRLIDHLTLAEIATKYGKTPIQVSLAWAVTQGRSVIPKSAIKWQIEENLQADFELAEADLAKIATMDGKARFNDPSIDFGYNLYTGLNGALS